ncbi:TauD/TfdA family dioxygenase (plasmid) [Tistrella bauzanensis]|uniref:TauD/TfdA family dioxygenase n=1 Tax=Tistrella arctica TaxID=3133430 RepID=A0ABU9YNN9_9PROT
MIVTASGGPPAGADLTVGALQQAGTRLVTVQPADAVTARPIEAHAEQLRHLAALHLDDCGAVLFRGFTVAGAAAFHALARGFAGSGGEGGGLLDYEFGSTPRSRIEGGVYSSTEYPAHQWIPQHNEQSYTRRWPMKIWFYCDLAPDTAGETPIADSRAVLARIDPAIRRRFADRGLMYVRNYGGGLDLPWSQVFGTSDRRAVEGFCRAQGIAWDWLDDDRLRTRQICQSEAVHPQTGEAVWFNQAHLFHVSALDPDLRETLLSVVDEEDLPRNVYYGDGAPLENAVLDEIRGAYQAEMLRFAWARGDVLMLDNMLVSHGRAPFNGSRRILVAMAEPHGAVELHGVAGG